MLYHFLYPFFEEYNLFYVFRYITLRSFIAFIVATTITILWGKHFIEFIKKKQYGQVVRTDGPKDHLKKSGTPTFGGVLIVIGMSGGLLLSGNFSSWPFLSSLVVMISYFCLGLYDDYLKVLKKNSKGVSGRGKLFWQFTTALLVSWALYAFDVVDSKLYFPFFKETFIDLGPFFILWSSIVIVGSSNAVNLTDGLDGLAIGPIMTACCTLAILSYLAGHREMSQYLYLPYVEHAGELVVLLLSIVGAGMGFLWYNAYPAQIFMGDVGALSLGGVLGTVAVLTKNELLFVLIGGIFVLEAISVILQVASFKMRGKRIFKMAPIHHHFELLGMAEPKVIVRFWIVSILLSMISLSTLKLR